MCGKFKIFKKGLLFGGFMGASMMWLNTTKKGREIREKLLDHAADVYESVKNEVMTSGAWKNMNKNKYVQMVNEYVDKYAIKTGLAEDTAKMLKKTLHSQWGRISGEIEEKKKK